MLAFLVTIVVTFAVFGSSQAALSDDYQNSTRLHSKNETNSTFELYWTYNKNESTISFAAKAKTYGWVGLGFTPRIDNTTTYDVVRGYLDELNSGKTEIYDFHAVGKETPIKDTQQNLMDTSVTKDGSYFVLKFKRLLDTKDPNDTVIQPGPMIVVWSYGNLLILKSGYTEIGYKTVTLIPEEPKISSTATSSKPTGPGSSAEVCRVGWVVLVLSAVLFMALGLGQV